MLQKQQRLVNTQLGLHTSQQNLNNLFHTSPQNSRLQSFFQQQQQQQHQPSQNTTIDDELGMPEYLDKLLKTTPHTLVFFIDFDPFFETQKGLAELIENEQQQTMQSNQTQTTKILDNSAQRCRLPPPGFSHMNAFGLGVPRAAATQTSTSKILPFMNNSGNASHNWPHHTGQQNSLNYGVHDQMSNLLPKSNHQANKGMIKD